MLLCDVSVVIQLYWPSNGVVMQAASVASGNYMNVKMGSAGLVHSKAFPCILNWSMYSSSFCTNACFEGNVPLRAIFACTRIDNIPIIRANTSMRAAAHMRTPPRLPRRSYPPA